METTPKPALDFSISTGGPFYNLLKKIGVQDSNRKLAVACLLLTWVPLLIITAIEGTLYAGTELPFLKDAAMQARILIALPLLLLINVPIDFKVNTVLKYLSETLLDQNEQQAFVNSALRRSKRLIGSAITEIIIILFVIITTAGFVQAGVFAGMEGGTTSWLTSALSGNQSLSMAGYWAVCVSIPVFQFLMLRWLWRYIVWTYFIYRFSKSGLDLLPTHADRCGGIGIFILAQKSFALIFLAGSIVISGQFIALLLKHPDQFDSLRSTGIGYIVISVVFLLLPLLFFMGNLIQLKNKGLMQLSDLGVKLSRTFEQDWLSDKSATDFVQDPVNPSMVYDYNGMYDNLQQIRVLPVNPRDVISVAVLLFVPFIPVPLIHFSVAEMLQRIAGMLI